MKSPSVSGAGRTSSSRSVETRPNRIAHIAACRNSPSYERAMTDNAITDNEGRTVTKRELVNRIAEDMGQTKVVVRDVLQRFLNEIIGELAVGNRLEFREFGVFEVRERAARTAQNPRTLEKVSVPAKRVVKFKVGRVMRQRVCDEEPGEASRPGEAAMDKSTGATGMAQENGGGRPPGSPAPGGDERSHDTVQPPARPQPPTPPPSTPGSPF